MADGENEWSDEYVQQAEETSFECDAVVQNARMEMKDLPSGGSAKYLMLTLKPTSYEGDVIERQYKIAKQAKGKWIPFLKGLKACGVNAAGPESLIGKEFHWKNITVTKFTNAEGDEVVVTSLVPTALLTQGASGATTSAPKHSAAAPATPAAPAPSGDNEAKILDFITKKGGTNRIEIAKELSVRMPDVIKTLTKLKEQKKVVEEGGAIMPSQ